MRGCHMSPPALSYSPFLCFMPCLIFFSLVLSPIESFCDVSLSLSLSLSLPLFLCPIQADGAREDDLDIHDDRLSYLSAPGSQTTHSLCSFSFSPNLDYL